MVAITVLSGAASAVLLDFPYESNSLTAAFLVLSIPVLGSLGFAIHRAFRSFWNYYYHKLPDPPALKAHLEVLRTWHVTAGTPANEVNSAAGRDFQDYIDDRLAEAVQANGRNNITRGNYLHSATAAVGLALVFFIPTAATYVYSKATAEDRIHQVQLVPNSISLKEPAMTTTPAPAPTPSAPAAAPSAPAPTVSVAKPAGPPNTVFKSGETLPSPRASSGSGKK